MGAQPAALAVDGEDCGALQQPVEHGGGDGFEGHGMEDTDALVNRADRALYAAKRAGRDRIFDARKLDAAAGLAAVS